MLDARYQNALRQITEARAGWQAWGWYLTLKPTLGNQDQKDLKRQFNIVAYQRGWAFRAGKDDATKPIDVRFNTQILGKLIEIKPVEISVVDQSQERIPIEV